MVAESPMAVCALTSKGVLQRMHAAAPGGLEVWQFGHSAVIQPVAGDQDLGTIELVDTIADDPGAMAVTILKLSGTAFASRSTVVLSGYTL
jgi:hypothetical protein